MYLLDTNTVIYFFKDKGQVATRWFQHLLTDIGAATRRRHLVTHSPSLP